MKLLVVGSHGLVGTNIIPFLSNHFEVVGLDIDNWNILDADKGKLVVDEHKPHVMINLAAMTDVDGCEDQREKAEKLNSEGPAVLARLCREFNVRFIHFSTDYVFDGKKRTPYTEQDTPNPTSVYGATKLAGERNVQEILPSSIILRTQWIYGKGGENFISKVVKAACETGSVKVVNDQRGSPTYAKDLGAPIKDLIQSDDASGIYHITNNGSCTWYDFAKQIFSLRHMDVSVVPISTSKLDRRAKRPAYSVFDCSKLLSVTGATMRPWQEALNDYLLNSQ